MGVLLIRSGAVTYSSSVTHRAERDEGTGLHNELDSSGEELFLVFFRSYCPHRRTDETCNQNRRCTVCDSKRKTFDYKSADLPLL
jgi:hypothetical protein